jgi:threonine synthase
MTLTLVSPDCGEAYPIDTLEWECIRCGRQLEVEGTRAFDPALIDTHVSSLWRYRPFLPLGDNSPAVTLGEGWTPMIPARGSTDLWYKLDFLMPTGSFKDRGSSVIVTALREMGRDRLVADSSGNAAASLAAYSARAGIGARIFVPSHASPTKLAQIRMYGAEMVHVEGPRENATRAAQDSVVTAGAYYASHHYNPFAAAGMQTTAWEIWEQLGQEPAHVILPAGHGTNFVGIYHGFQALLRKRLIKAMPRLYAAQAANVAPLAAAFQNRSSEPAEVPPAQTIADGIAISRPNRGKAVLRAIRETGGAAVAVSEDEIRRARAQLALEGIYVEPTSASAAAVYHRLQTRFLPGESTVVILTGSGLKTPPDQGEPFA